MIKYTIQEVIGWATSFFSSGDGHAKGLLVLLHLGLEGITDVDTDPKGKFVPFKTTPNNGRVLCVYAPSRYRIREQLARGVSLEDYKIIWKIRMEEMKRK